MTRNGVDVETPLGTVSGRTALVTVSTNVLASGRIAFEPELPAWKTAAAQALPLGVAQQDCDRAERSVRGPPRIAVPDRDDARPRRARRAVREALRLRLRRGKHHGPIRGLARAMRQGGVRRVPGRALQGRVRQQHHGLPHRPRHRHHLARRSLDPRRLLPRPGRARRTSGRSWRVRSTIACSSPAKRRRRIPSAPVTART